MALEPMPPTVDRRPYDDEHYPGYLESDADWARNNWEAVNWLADNHEAIRDAIEANPMQPNLLDAAKDALAGWQYIRAKHGDLYGVGWERVEQSLTAAIAAQEA